MENELYEFALEQFEFTKKKLMQPDNKHLQQFMYEKIRPKWLQMRLKCKGRLKGRGKSKKANRKIAGCSSSSITV